MAKLADVEEVDRFIAVSKRLFGSPPEFGPKMNSRDGAHWEAVWPVSDELGVLADGAFVRVRASPSSDKPFSLVLIFRDSCVFRLDFVSESICHVNPFWASSRGLPPRVCGPHCHTWAANREHVLSSGFWEMPCREPLAPQIRKFDQAFAWFAQQGNLILSPDQRAFDLPAELF